MTSLKVDASCNPKTTLEKEEDKILQSVYCFIDE